MATITLERLAELFPSEDLEVLEHYKPAVDYFVSSVPGMEDMSADTLESAYSIRPSLTQLAGCATLILENNKVDDKVDYEVLGKLLGHALTIIVFWGKLRDDIFEVGYDESVKLMAENRQDYSDEILQVMKEEAPTFTCLLNCVYYCILLNPNEYPTDYIKAGMRILYEHFGE